MVKEEPTHKKRRKTPQQFLEGHRIYVQEILRTQVSPQLCSTAITIMGLLP